MPRQSIDAILLGWLPIQSSENCTNDGKFFGFRYQIPGDEAITLLFDKNGYIAGIQAQV
jgi:hypothetical protein